MYSSSMDSTEYSEGDYRLTLAFEMQFRTARAVLVGYPQPTQPPALHCCLLLAPGAYNEVIITL